MNNFYLAGILFIKRAYFRSFFGFLLVDFLSKKYFFGGNLVF